MLAISKPQMWTDYNEYITGNTTAQKTVTATLKLVKLKRSFQAKCTKILFQYT